MHGSEVDFFATNAEQRKSLRQLSARKLAAFEKELRRSPPYSKDSPLLQLVIREGDVRKRAAEKRPTIRKTVTAITKPRRK